MFREKMVTPAIPERVYTLCKIVEEAPIPISKLKGKMEPDYLDQTTSYFSFYRNAAEELKLINVSDNVASLAVKPEVLKSTSCMRQYVNSILEDFQSGQFYQVTKAYYNLDSKVLHGDQNVANLASPLSKLINNKVDAVAMRAWRFWISFLGFGQLQGDDGMFVIPNAGVFLHDIIELVDFEKGKMYSFGEFIAKILPFSKIIIDSDPANRQLNYGVSNGLRTLHDMGFIELKHILDQADIWNLYPLQAHKISGTVTNVTVL